MNFTTDLLCESCGWKGYAIELQPERLPTSWWQRFAAWLKLGTRCPKCMGTKFANIW